MQEFCIGDRVIFNAGGTEWFELRDATATIIAQSDDMGDDVFKIQLDRDITPGSTFGLSDYDERTRTFYSGEWLLTLLEREEHQVQIDDLHGLV